MESNYKGAEMKTWEIVAIIYSIIGWMVISTVNLESDESVPFKEKKTLSGYFFTTLCAELSRLPSVVTRFPCIFLYF